MTSVCFLEVPKGTYVSCLRSFLCGPESWTHCCCGGMTGDCQASCGLLRKEQGRDCPVHVLATPAATKITNPNKNPAPASAHRWTQVFSHLTVTFITEVTILEGRLWPCAAAAMFAMVLRWFIWLIAMVTEAGGKLTGIRGCGIIMKGSSKPETHEEVVDYSMMRIMAEIFTGESCEDLTGKQFYLAASYSHCHQTIKQNTLWWRKIIESFKWVTC